MGWLRLGANRVVLTHMSLDMLAAAGEIARRAGVIMAEDGMVMEI